MSDKSVQVIPFRTDFYPYKTDFIQTSINSKINLKFRLQIQHSKADTFEKEALISIHLFPLVFVNARHFI